jgi:hypothetical protein
MPPEYFYTPVIGFSPSQLVGVERRESYTVQVGYLSGRPSPQILNLQLQMELGTASK